ncbi:MAG: SUMF1/EgtB/PvdO family nonheme iron enzyme [bacterium]
MTEWLIGDYRIIGDLGAGGMASVYLAVHRDVPNLKVVLKKLKDRTLVDRFIREADKLALLSGHPGICQIRHFFDHEGDFYIAMEHIDGGNLGQLIDSEDGLEHDRALEIMLSVLHTLDFAHRKGISHRDIKPTNIMVDKHGQVKVIDFGIAKGKFDSDLTTVGTRLGSPRYMPPEQYSPDRKTDWARCDVYAVGGTLYHALTGRPPFKATDLLDLKDEKERGEIAPPSGIDSALSRELDTVILRALAVDPVDRHADAAEMLADLQSVTKCDLPTMLVSPPEQDLECTLDGTLAKTQPAHDPPPASSAVPELEQEPESLLETVPMIAQEPEPGQRSEPTPSSPPEPPLLSSPGDRRRRGAMLAAGVLMLVLAAVGIRHITQDNRGGTEVVPPMVRITNAIGMELVQIPEGTFLMGSASREPERKSDETQHQVTISRPFFMSTTEVTQEQWLSVMGDNPSRFRECGGDCPVDSVSWQDAIRFCNLLSELDGRHPVYVLDDREVTWTRDAGGYRLPTEAEWEYACRAGTETPFNTGDCLATDLANYHGEISYEGCQAGLNRQRPIRAGSFPPNAFGLDDMHGNVWEWCWDWYGDYPDAEHITDPSGPPVGERRVLRGGAWSRSAEFCRSANRTGNFLSFRRDCDGFRVVLPCIEEEPDTTVVDRTIPGTVVVTIDPAGGTLYVDGSLVGSDLDGRTLELPPGAHIVRVEHPGSTEGVLKRQVDVITGSNQDLAFVFTFTPKTEFGTVRIGSRPGWGYDIYIDGERQDRPTPAEFTLPVGKHVIKVIAVLDGVAREQEMEITIVPGHNDNRFFEFDQAD